MVQLNDVYTRVNDRWVSRFILDEVVIMPLGRSRDDLTYIYSISNETGSRIWKLLDGRHSIKDIQDILMAEYHGQKEAIEREVLEFINDLAQDKLIKKTEPLVRSPQVVVRRPSNKKKAYISPEIAKVKMEPEQAVLACCTSLNVNGTGKTDTAGKVPPQNVCSYGVGCATGLCNWNGANDVTLNAQSS